MGGIARTISRWLDYEAHERAERFLRIRCRLDEARWWLGSNHPEAAALAEYVMRDDAQYWGEGSVRRNKWSPPDWVSSIDKFRGWLASEPFADKGGRSANSISSTTNDE